jgi:hypothetical protein
MDNFFQNCPPKMDDQGRQLTDFQTSTRKNEYIKYINNIYRDDQYRLFLQLNAKEIMDRDWAYNRQHNSCWDNACIHKYPLRVVPRQMWQERQAYDSIFNPNTHQQLAPLRQCEKFKDYRATS